MIGIIGAMSIEVEAVKKLMKHVQEVQFQGTTFYQGTLHDKEVVLMLSGVGKGNASMNTTMLCMRYPITTIINIGTAGGLLAEQKVLDIVISDDVIQHDYDTSFLDGIEGIGLHFKANQELVTLAKSTLAQEEVQVFVGNIVSGDQFIADRSQIDAIKKNFPMAMCAEMEAGAIAQVASRFQLPFIVLRSLSDVALNEDSHLDFMEYAKAASVRSAKFCFDFVTFIA